MKTSTLITCALLAASITAFAADHDSKKFLAESAQDGIAEIRICKLALQKSQNADVKKFAQRMITDHTRMDNEIKALAQKKGLTLPTDPTIKQRLTYDTVSVLSGHLFDREFMSHNVSDHETDVKDFKEQIDQGNDPDVKAFAAQGLKTLQTHLQLSKEVEQKVKAAGEKK